ncbi:Tricorn protease-like protein [Sulfidibacter corallicola]|uniref:Tricorn protease homolog n=1 Tax=Sulfidibacter corallicola TaxID=2818388 RepID=A0A8A4TSP5_SULCO|nr:S41 family peptidase [Sulfidibacter corallicola]QTD52523.1 PD40 domain-containing protein [Sulfidibacter corallicola]
MRPKAYPSAVQKPNRIIPQMLFCLISLCLGNLIASDGYQPHGGMIRYPDVSQTHIVFSYANDLWLVPREGGTATPLASPGGTELTPRFSPDGETVAFSANFDGDEDLYTIPTSGGIPDRVTHHPGFEFLSDWTPDGQSLIFFSRSIEGFPRATQLFTVSATGGLPTKMPVPYGANGTIHSDGEWLAYTPRFRDYRTWKRYRGGQAAEIWLFNLENNSSKKVTDWEGTDTMPMWHGKTLYYLSDNGPNHRLNIWAYDTESGQRRQVTKLADYDVKFPSIGPGPNGQGEIVFQYGSQLHLLDLAKGTHAAVSVRLPGSRPALRTAPVDAAENLTTNRFLSSSAKRVAVEARGDIWTLPVKHGTPRNLTRTSGRAERDPAWSPDGKWIAFFADDDYEQGYNLFITQSDGRGETRKLTNLDKQYLFTPSWSPNSEKIAFWNQLGQLFLHDLASGQTKEIAKDRFGGTSSLAWTHDSRWLAMSLSLEATNALFVYHTETDKLHQLTSGMFNDYRPTFDEKGKYLAFLSDRHAADPTYEDYGTTWVYSGQDRILVVPLKKGEKVPFAPKSDEESFEDDDDAGENGKDEDDEDDEKDSKKKGKKKKGKKDAKKDKDDVKPIEFDLDGFEKRAVPVPVDHGNLSNLVFGRKAKLFYIRGAANRDRKSNQLTMVDLKDAELEEKTVVKGLVSFMLSEKREKMLVFKAPKRMAVIDAKPKQKMKDMVSTKGMTVQVNPREEWTQIFHEAWRLYREFFYAPNMHGLDWKAVRDSYAEMLADATTRGEVGYVLSEMISELNVGHAYHGNARDKGRPSNVNVGLLGADFSLENDAFRIRKIYRGGDWDASVRSPLDLPGIDVAEGDYLLAVNGEPLDTTKDVWASFLNLANRVVTLTVSKKPAMDDEARQVVVRTLRSDSELRLRDWIERNRDYVAKKTGGKVGYIYVRNTGIPGQNDLIRQLIGQRRKQALIIDERWNGGGQIPTRFIELLNRPLVNHWSLRVEEDVPWPPDAHHGPKCMLINGSAGSGGDHFPFLFRRMGLGKLIGTRTWGGLVGLSGGPRFVDGGVVTVPSFAFFETDGTWGIEGHGVDPDIEVVADPAKMVDGADPQLDRAIEQMLEELKTYPKIPKRPAYPDRSGMGLPDSEK